MNTRLLRAGVITSVMAVLLSGCGFSPYKLPLPGGADLGSDPYTVKVQFRDVLDLVPQSAVRVNDIAVGKVTDIKLNGWTATRHGQGQQRRQAAGQRRGDDPPDQPAGREVRLARAAEDRRRGHPRATAT